MFDFLALHYFYNNFMLTLSLSLSLPLHTLRVISTIHIYGKLTFLVKLLHTSNRLANHYMYL